MAETNNASDHSLLWGYSVEFWDWFGIRALIWGAALGVAALLLTAASAYILYRVADIAQKELETDSKASAERIAAANERTAELAKETEELKASNALVEKSLQPRLFLSDGIGLFAYSGTKFLIDGMRDDESMRAAETLKNLLVQRGWVPLSPVPPADKLIPANPISPVDDIFGIDIRYGYPATPGPPKPSWTLQSGKAANALKEECDRLDIAAHLSQRETALDEDTIRVIINPRLSLNALKRRAESARRMGEHLKRFFPPQPNP